MNKLLKNIKIKNIIGEFPSCVSSVCSDSRLVEKNSLFVAIKGTKLDGHDHIEGAIEKGCSVVVCEQLPANLISDVCYVQVADSALAISVLASNFYDNPSEKLKLVGVTGTNGKTTIVTLLYNLFTSLGYCCGLLSTVHNIVDKEVIPSTHTTPDPVSLNKLLARMVDNGCEYCFMEVSSHSVVQKRISGLTFCGGIFTNITHDHLDYHKTFVNYIAAKKAFFTMLPADAFAVVNADDRNGLLMVENSKAKVYTYSIRGMADFHAKLLEMKIDGTLARINNGEEFWMALPGEFNASNQLAVFAAASLLSVDKYELMVKLSMIKGAKGRFEVVKNSCNKNVVVDYAHTPDALKNILSTVCELADGQGRVLCVFGAGGDRDSSKRSEMGVVSVKYADLVVVTSDNPRSENPDAIIKDIVSEIDPVSMKKIICITDRKEAIRVAVNMLNDDDVLVVAGKGHENYQEINGVKYHFDDVEIIDELLNN